MPHQLTIRYDDELARKIEALAQEEGLSRNKLIARLLRKAAGLDEATTDQNVIGDSLDWFIGSWSEQRAAEFEEATGDFETIDEDLWD
jgi:predicted transcriptional regulator